jgi:hypothetical protein
MKRQRIIVTTSLALTSNERVVVNQKDANEWDYNVMISLIYF